jgi:hypothetical protein
MSLTASASPEHPVAFVRYLDVVLVVIAAPILLLIGVPALGYGVGAGAWIVLRAVGEGVDRYASTLGDQRRELPLRLGFLLSRLFALALAVILVRRSGTRDDGLTALLVIVFAYTVSLILSFFTRSLSR